MALPNTGMDAVPFTPLTAEFLDDMIQNIEYLGSILDGTNPTGPDGWNVMSALNPTVTYNGNRSYNLVYSSTNYTSLVSPGSRLKFTRTVSAPTQSTSLNGTNQYYSKTSPAAMTFTDDFVVSAWIKLSSYTTGSIVSRYNGTSGWDLRLTGTGQVNLIAYNAGSANARDVFSYTSVPLNKWVHVAAQLDMSSNTVGTTLNYVMIDGLDVPASATSVGSNPTALIQAGNLEIGSRNAGTQPFPGKIAQVAIYNAKVTQATIRASIAQALVGTETSLISAYSFNNSINDLNTTSANNLTSQNSAVATNADTPFTNPVAGTSVTGGTVNYAIVMSQSFSTNTTLVVQAPEGETLPTTGGISATSYSSQKTPYGFPSQKGKWSVKVYGRGNFSQGTPVASTWYNVGSQKINVPVGSWIIGYQQPLYADRGTSGVLSVYCTLSIANNSESDTEMTATNNSGISTANAVSAMLANRSRELDVTIATDYFLNIRTTDSGLATIYVLGASSGTATITLDNAYV